MNLTVKIEADGAEVCTVNSLEELYNAIKGYDPSVFVQIVFVETGKIFEQTVSATVDP